MTRWRDCSDGQLLRQAATDRDAFGELYSRHEAAVAAFLARRTRDAEATADLTAETFATALLRARSFRDEGEPALGWLLGIANIALLRARKRGRIERRALERLGVDPIVFSDASLERIEALIDASAADNPLLRALDQLPETQRDAVRSRILDERSYEALERDLGVPTATVRQRVSRGLARLRATLEEH